MQTIRGRETCVRRPRFDRTDKPADAVESGTMCSSLLFGDFKEKRYQRPVEFVNEKMGSAKTQRSPQTLHCDQSGRHNKTFTYQQPANAKPRAE
jgi:hypothetical protein